MSAAIPAATRRHRRAAAVIRYIGIVISAAVVLLGLLWVAFESRKQGWRDKMAITLVVHAGR